MKPDAGPARSQPGIPFFPGERAGLRKGPELCKPSKYEPNANLLPRWSASTALNRPYCRA